jgi:hypothetical protein
VRWNTTFKAFADFWGFEPRLCRAYRAQTKGKVESGVKYFKRNFLAGRRFRDDLDFNEQLQEWMATVADVRVHGTTHERPIERFARERDALVPAPPGRAFRLEAPLTRVGAVGWAAASRPAPVLVRQGDGPRPPVRSPGRTTPTARVAQGRVRGVRGKGRATPRMPKPPGV